MGRNNVRWAKTSSIEEKLVALQNRISDAESKIIEDVDARESYVFFENLSIQDSDEVAVFTEFGYYFSKEVCNSYPDFTSTITFPSAINSFIMNGAYIYAKKYGEFSVQTVNNMLTTTDLSDNFVQIKGISGRVYDMQKSHVSNGVTFYRVRSFSESDISDLPSGMTEARSYTKVESVAIDRLSVELLTPIDMTGIVEVFFYGNILDS